MSIEQLSESETIQLSRNPQLQRSNLNHVTIALFNTTRHATLTGSRCPAFASTKRVSSFFFLIHPQKPRSAGLQFALKHRGSPHMASLCAWRVGSVAWRTTAAHARAPAAPFAAPCIRRTSSNNTTITSSSSASSGTAHQQQRTSVAPRSAADDALGPLEGDNPAASARGKPPGRQPLPPAVPAAAAAESAIEAAARLLSAPGAAYTRALEARPLLTKACTSFVGFMLGDVIAQHVGHQTASLDVLRVLRLGLYGLCIDGPLGAKWYDFLVRVCWRVRWVVGRGEMCKGEWREGMGAMVYVTSTQKAPRTRVQQQLPPPAPLSTPQHLTIPFPPPPPNPPTHRRPKSTPRARATPTRCSSRRRWTSWSTPPSAPRCSSRSSPCWRGAPPRCRTWWPPSSGRR